MFESTVGHSLMWESMCTFRLTVLKKSCMLYAVSVKFVVLFFVCVRVGSSLQKKSGPSLR